MNLKKEECCGCGVCETLCSANAIKMIEDEEGFVYPEIEKNLCTECGTCREACRFLHDCKKRGDRPEKINTDRDVYIGRHRDMEIVASSRSGGIFTALSDDVLAEGGAVYGAVLMNDNSIQHILAEDISTRDRMRGSKYAQSYVDIQIYRQIKDRLSLGQKVLFSGTSCQVAALKSYLDKDYENLLYMDIVCHGVVSPLVLREYINVWEKCVEARCTHIDFREKGSYGWTAHVERLFFENTSRGSFYLDSSIYRNLFYGHLTLRPSCYVCPYKTQEHPGDITVADCWGIDKIEKDYFDDAGCSLIFINNKKGERTFQKIKRNIDVKSTKMCEEIFQQPLSYPFKVDQNERNRFWNRFLTGDKRMIMEEYGQGTFM